MSPATREGSLLAAGALVLDAALALFLALILLIVVTGGGVFEPFGIRISARTVGNPLLVVHLLLLLRLTVLRAVPIFRVRALGVDALARSALVATNHVSDLLRSLGPRQSRMVLFWMSAVFILAKLGNAYWYPGFFSGDDVEIHEMTFRSLFRTDWPLWEIRSPLYPFLIIYPVQALFVTAGEQDTSVLVFAGRCSVVVLSTIAVWLAYRIGAVTAGFGHGVVAALLFGLHRLHIAFGGSELPRPVSAVLIAAACLLLLGRAAYSRAMLAGAFLAIGAAFRGSELIFLAPAALHLLADRRYRDLVLFSATFVVTAAICFGMADWIFWGESFFSLQNLFRYTVVERLSSRGYEPPWYYLLALPDWTSLPVFALALIGGTVGRRIALWWTIPLVSLSLFPHKEPRYVIPLLPFFCVSAALGLGRVLRWLRELTVPSRVRAERLALAVMILLAGALVFELSGWRFRKSAEGIVVARYIDAAGCSGAVAFEQSWRAGGRLYLRECELTDIDPAKSMDAAYLRNVAGRRNVQWMVIRKSDLGVEVLRAAGFRLETIGGAPTYIVGRRASVTPG